MLLVPVVTGAGFHVGTAQCHTACLRVAREKEMHFTDVKSSFSPETLLSHLFVFVLITALRAATKTPLAFMRLMKVSADGKRRGAPPCAHAWLCEFTGAS